MSFHGDVAGLGLAEVLQSIGRGDKEGVLNLDAGEIKARLGMRDGLLYPLPSPEEEADSWRERCQSAWAEDPQPTLESQRRERIARAARLEALYRLIEAENVHFSFKPGSLDAWAPQAASPLLDEANDRPEGDLWGPGIPVEYLLLEHARLSDEANDLEAYYLRGFDIPRFLGGENLSENDHAFLAHCDGLSTISEVADRMGWTLTQTRGTIGKFIQAGIVQMATEREFLVLAQREMEFSRFPRAAERLTAWSRRSVPGPIFVGDLHLFHNEWKMNRMAPTLQLMPTREARAILRRLDLSEQASEASTERWEVLCEASRGDTLTIARTFLWRMRAEVAPDPQMMSELLRVARAMQEKGLANRARTLLRLVAMRAPQQLGTRLELGTRLVESGLLEEGSRWLIEVARELINSKQADRAVAPLRTILRADPNHRDAHGLLLETHAHSARRRRRKFSSAIVLAIVVILGGVAFVHMHREKRYGDRIEEVSSLRERPVKAMRLLEKYFAKDDSDRIVGLRNEITRKLREEALTTKQVWLDDYEEVNQECQFGDPLLGLQQALDLSSPPQFDHIDLGPWPNRAELLNVLANSMQKDAEALILPIDATVEQKHIEERMITQLGEVLEIASKAKKTDETDAFMFRVESVREDLLARREQRAKDRERRERALYAQEQDKILNSARAHAAAGDFERALASYDRLLDQEDPEEAEALAKLFGEEVKEVSDHFDAYREALRLCEAGRHAEGRKVLDPFCDDLGEHLMPWKVETLPPGARVELGNGVVRTTPFVMQTPFGQPMDLSFTLDKYEPEVVELDDIQDVRIHLHLAAERVWKSRSHVEAAPVPSGRDHIVADRAGHIARLDPQGEIQWEREVKSLGGIARTPVFLSGRPGQLLFLTEDGEAWVLDANSGEVEGPWSAGSPPKEGPVPTRSGVSALFENGQVGVWTESVEPELFDAEETFFKAGVTRDFGAQTPNVVVLRRAADQDDRLESRWTPWSVEVHAGEYVVRHEGDGAFTIDANGDWEYVAWEAPNALIPDGRLWISDGRGLRAFLPSVDLLYEGYDSE